MKDVAAAETRISYVNPSGSLYYVGYNIDDLVGRIYYAEVAYLFMYRRLPNQRELDKFSSDLVAEMRLPNEVVDSIRSTPKSCHPMDVLRTEVSHLGEFDPEGSSMSRNANTRRAIRLIAQVPEPFVIDRRVVMITPFVCLVDFRQRCEIIMIGEGLHFLPEALKLPVDFPGQ